MAYLKTDFAISTGIDSEGGFTQMVITYYHQTSKQFIQEEMIGLIRESVKKFLSEDERFHSDLEKVTREVCANLPLDEIRAAVKSAIAENRIPGGSHT